MSSDNDHGDETMEFEYKKIDHRSNRTNTQADDASTFADGAAEDVAAQTPDENAAQAEPLNLDIYQILRLMVGMISEQAWIGLGLHPRAGSSDLEMRLPEAKTCIDTLRFIREQLEGNLQEEEKRELDNLVSTLQMNYIRRA